MKVYSTLHEIPAIPPTAVALGNFDGVHKGHTELIQRMVRYATGHGLKSGVFTFSNHPQNVIAGQIVVKHILSPTDKIERIAELGVDYLFSLPFDDSFHTMTPEDFIDRLLLEKFHARSVSCGFNFHFGKDASGGSDFLRHVGEREHFDVEVLSPYRVAGHLVSSSLIRDCIASGRVEQCEKYLGRPFSLAGEVIRGNRIGGAIGFPTANLKPSAAQICPANGVYASFCARKGRLYPAMTNVGVRPTVDGKEYLVETHLFDEEAGREGRLGDLYGENIRVFFHKKLRDEIRFDGKEALAAQLARDRENAISLLKGSPNPSLR